MALLEIETDCLIIGSGAAGLAFADTLIAGVAPEVHLDHAARNA